MNVGLNVSARSSTSRSLEPAAEAAPAGEPVDEKGLPLDGASAEESTGHSTGFGALLQGLMLPVDAAVTDPTVAEADAEAPTSEVADVAAETLPNTEEAVGKDGGAALRGGPGRPPPPEMPSRTMVPPPTEPLGSEAAASASGEFGGSGGPEVPSAPSAGHDPGFSGYRGPDNREPSQTVLKTAGEKVEQVLAQQMTAKGGAKASEAAQTPNVPQVPKAAPSADGEAAEEPARGRADSVPAEISRVSALASPKEAAGAKSGKSEEGGTTTAEVAEVPQVAAASRQALGKGGLTAAAVPGKAEGMQVAADTYAGSETPEVSKAGAHPPAGTEAPAIANLQSAIRDSDEAALGDEAARVTVGRLVRAVRLTVRNDGGHAEVQLQPPSLGRVRLEVWVRDGVMSATLETSTRQANDLLKEHLPALRLALERSGLTVERLEATSREGRSGEDTSNADGRSGAFAGRHGTYQSPDGHGSSPWDGWRPQMSLGAGLRGSDGAEALPEAEMPVGRVSLMAAPAALDVLA